MALEDYTIKESHIILNQLSSVVPHLPILDGWSQEIAGVIHGEIPKFFAVEYYNEESDEVADEPTFFVDIKSIECEESEECEACEECEESNFRVRREEGRARDEK